MGCASSIEARLKAMKEVYEAGKRTVCFISPIFPGITDWKGIIERVKDFTDLIRLENLNLRDRFRSVIMDYILYREQIRLKKQLEEAFLAEEPLAHPGLSYDCLERVSINRSICK